MRTDIFEAIFMEKKENGEINYAAIGRKYNCDPRTVKRYFNARDANPIERKQRIIKKKTDGFEQIITEKYLKFEAPAISIYKLLKKRYGYTGSYTTIKSFVHDLKEDKRNEATIRFETNPGLQCQIDWKESLTLVNKNNQVFVINIFLSVLGYSRLKYIELTLDRAQPTLFRCLANAFHYFGGVPKELLFDNMKTVVDRSRTQFEKPIYNQTFYAFSKDAGFEAKSCISFRPRTKGKVEVVAKIMNRLKAFNNEFETLNDLEKIVKELMFEINNEKQETIQEKPFIKYQNEKEYLSPEPNYEILEAYYSKKPLSRKVPKDALICFRNNKYSVPPKYIGKIITIKCEGNNLSIYYNENFICSHIVTDKSINYKPEHYKELATMTLKDSDLIKAVCENNLNIFDKL